MEGEITNGRLILENVTLLGSCNFRRTSVKIVNSSLLDLTVKLRKCSLNLTSVTATVFQLRAKHCKIKLKDCQFRNSSLSTSYCKLKAKKCTSQSSTLNIVSGISYLRRLLEFNIEARGLAVVDIANSNLSVKAYPGTKVLTARSIITNKSTEIIYSV